jgi:hypothetical protein
VRPSRHYLQVWDKDDGPPLFTERPV